MKELLKLSSSRKGRLLATIIGPPLLGGLVCAAIIVVLMIFTEAAPVSQKIMLVAPLVILSVVWAYVFVGVQSLVASLLMEFVIRRFANRKFHIVVSAAIMGLLASATYRMDQPFFMILGLLIGVCFGLFLSHSFQAGQFGNESG